MHFKRLFFKSYIKTKNKMLLNTLVFHPLKKPSLEGKKQFQQVNIMKQNWIKHQLDLFN